MTQPRRAPRSADRSILESPWLAAMLAIAALAIAAVLVLPGLLGGGPFASPTPGASAQPSPSPSPAQPTFVRPTPSPQPTFLSYVVQAGDTLNSIAREFRTTARSIAWWNRGAHPSLDPESEGYDPDRLDIGWILQVLPDSVVDDTNPPTPSPAPATETPAATVLAATSAPTPMPTPRPTLAGDAAIGVFHGPRTVPNIALTFDMGGRLDPAVDIVRWLIDHDVHATLFPTGTSGTQTTQGLAAMQLAATRPDLFDIGNHSWDHPDFTRLSAAAMAEQLNRTEAALFPIVGTTRPWFRPPFGASSSAVRSGVGAAGWATMAMWDIDTIDWRPEDNGDGPAGPTTAEIVAKVASNARGGSIVLMHLGGWHTLEALPGILEACGNLGLEPVTLTEMLGA